MQRGYKKAKIKNLLMIYYYLFVILVVFNLCFFSNVIAKKTKLIDYPHKDKIHAKPTPQ